MIEIIKKNIKIQSKKNGLTIQSLCKVLRKDRNYINRITNEVKLNKIISIANAIGCTPSELLEGL